MKKLLTLDDLYHFCEQNNFTAFSSKDSGYRVVVQIPSTFEEVEDDDLTRAGLMKLRIKVAHIGKNRNNSYISEENMMKALPSLKNRPLLGYIHQLQDGTYDFWSHNIEIIEDEDGNQEVNYLESQIGSFTEDDPILEYDEEQDKTYAVAYAVVPEGYSKAADIIRAKKGTKNSCELFIDKFVYNGEEHCIELVDFFFGGSTMLGSDSEGNEIKEGMAGSRADIVDFADTSSINLDNEKKEGGSELLDELLKKYNKTLEDLTFEYAELSDEELEAKFAELFDEDEDDSADETTEDEFDDDEDESDEDDDEVAEELDNAMEEAVDDVVDAVSDLFDSNEEPEQKPVESQVTFELSFDEIRSAIYQLTSIYRNDDEWCYPCQFFADHFMMEDWDNDKFYKQSYSIDEEDKVSLVGERTEMFVEWLTESEKTALEAMRSNYAAMEKKVAEYEKAEVDAQKNEIFADPSYANYLETEVFVKLIEDKDNYTVEELAKEAELAFAKCVKTEGNFSLDVDTKPQRKTVAFGKDNREEKKPYGNLFD